MLIAALFTRAKTWKQPKCTPIDERIKNTQYIYTVDYYSFIKIMGKTRDLFKKVGDTNGIFHAKMGSIEDRNGKNVTEAEDIEKMWQEYIEELYKKGLNDPNNHNGVVTHVEPDILECEVKWALGKMTKTKA